MSEPTKFYFQYADGSLASFEGMELNEIIDMLTERGLTYEVLDEETYNSKIAAHLHKP